MSEASESRRRRVGAASAPCRRSEQKKKKRDTAGHRNLARRPRSGVRYVSDADTTPKMACPCNLDLQYHVIHFHKLLVSLYHNIPMSLSVHPRLRHLELDSIFDLMVLLFSRHSFKSGCHAYVCLLLLGEVNGCPKRIGFESLFRNLVSKLS